METIEEEDYYKSGTVQWLLYLNERKDWSLAKEMARTLRSGKAFWQDLNNRRNPGSLDRRG